MANLNPSICGENNIYVPPTGTGGCDDCDRLAAEFEQAARDAANAAADAVSAANQAQSDASTASSSATSANSSATAAENSANEAAEYALTTLEVARLTVVPREKDITPYWRDGTLRDRIAGTNGFKKYDDIFPGDYIDMGRTVTCPNIDGGSNPVTTGSQFVTVASCGGLWGNGDSNPITYPHLVMVPGKGVGGTQHFGRHRMNPTNTTEGGYTNSVMNKQVIGDVVTAGSIAEGATINQQLKYIFGDLLKTVRELCSNAVTSTLYNRYGAATGAASGWAWMDAQAILMSEAEVYGTVAWSSSGYDTGTAHHQFELFANNRQAINNRTVYYWLKDVASSSDFAYSSSSGYASNGGASYEDRYVRPRFILA